MVRIKLIRDLYRGINEFKKGFKYKTNLVQDNLLAESHSILNRYKNYFCQLLNVRGNILVSRLTLYVIKIIRYHHCQF
jgi:hypothetical protein